MVELLTLIAAFIGCALILPQAERVAPSLGMVDRPAARKVHARPIARTGGWGIALGASIPFLLAQGSGPMAASFAGAAALLFLFGSWDDARNLGHRTKFTGQIVAAALVVYHGDLWVQRFPLLGDLLLPAWIGRPFTVFALVGTMNAVNHSDGLDGLAGGESLLSLCTMGTLLLLSSSAGDPGAVLACATVGATAAFLRWNIHPARIFMGDTGSGFLGLALGTLAVYLTQVADVSVSPAAALLLIGLPVADLLVVLALRVRGHESWFAASRNHFHHRLLDRGFPHRVTVWILWSVQAVLVTSGYLLRSLPDWMLLAWYVAVCGALVLFLVAAERRGWTFHGELTAVRGDLPPN
ncbi:MAG: glycosyltransferase family 4 protein [Gammaproteobacteria bacterium]